MFLEVARRGGAIAPLAPSLNPPLIGATMYTFGQELLFIYARLRSSGSWKPFHDPQKFAFDSIKTARYVITNNSKMVFAVKARL